MRRLPLSDFWLVLASRAVKVAAASGKPYVPPREVDAEMDRLDAWHRRMVEAQRAG